MNKICHGLDEDLYSFIVSLYFMLNMIVSIQQKLYKTVKRKLLTRITLNLIICREIPEIRRQNILI